MSVVIKNNRQNSAGSLKTNIPTSTVPTAPTPVQTAYAVPIGNVWVALYSRNMLIERQTTNPAHHNVEVSPADSFAFPKHVANPTSKSPAIMRMIQFMV